MGHSDGAGVPLSGYVTAPQSPPGPPAATVGRAVGAGVAGSGAKVALGVEASCSAVGGRATPREHRGSCEERFCGGYRTRALG